jgi:hypothetical protein
MATKKKAEDTKAEEPKAAEKPEQDMGTADLVGKSIDERMAMLLKDHKRMGVR